MNPFTTVHSLMERILNEMPLPITCQANSLVVFFSIYPMIVANLDGFILVLSFRSTFSINAAIALQTL